MVVSRYLYPVSNLCSISLSEKSRILSIVPSVSNQSRNNSLLFIGSPMCTGYRINTTKKPRNERLFYTQDFLAKPPTRSKINGSASIMESSLQAIPLGQFLPVNFGFFRGLRSWPMLLIHWQELHLEFHTHSRSKTLKGLQ